MSDGLCVHCNYELQQLSVTRCPECGNDFDRADPLTINYGSQLTEMARWSLGPGGPLASIALVIAAGVGAWAARLPPGMSDRTPINGCLVTLLGIIWTSWPTICRWATQIRNWRVEWFTGSQTFRRWPGLMAISIGVTILLGLPRQIAFRASEPALNRIGEQLIKLRKSSPKDQWLGAFHTTSIHSIPGGAILTTTHERFSDSGFVYLPMIDPNVVTWPSRTYIADGWWSWREPR